MRKMKKIMAVVLATVMAVGVLPIAKEKTVVQAAGTTVADLVTDSKSSLHTKGFELTDKGFKVTFSTKMTTTVDWDSPQFAVYAADDDSAENAALDPAAANSKCYFIGRSDNYAFDATGNRHANATPLSNGNSYVFSGAFSRKDSGTATSNYSLEAYLLGSSAIITFGNETFTSTSRVTVDPSEKNYVSLIANYCDITNISFESLNNEVTTMNDVESVGYAVNFSDEIEVTDKGVYVSGISTSSDATQNFYGACVFAYNGDTPCAAVRPDCFSNIDKDVETLNGYTRDVVASYGGDWAAWNTRKTSGVGSLVHAKLSGTDLIIIVGNNTVGCTVTVKGIDVDKGVSLKLTGEKNKTTDIHVSKEADYTGIASYRGATYTAPTKEGKVFAGWYGDADFKTSIAEDVKTGYAYAKFVDADLLTTKCQITAGTTAQSEKANLRLMLGVDSLDYKSVGFEVASDGKNWDLNTDTVCSKINVTYGDNTVTEEPSKYFGTAKYVLPYTILNIPQADFGKTFTVTPYWVTLDGTTVKGATRSDISITSGISQQA